LKKTLKESGDAKMPRVKGVFQIRIELSEAKETHIAALAKSKSKGGTIRGFLEDEFERMVEKMYHTSVESFKKSRGY